ncbi:MAG: recombinase family protein, partial [Pseudomonadota bacterium]|nr:recombinase family protein [Pseudomonadota bacterium]
MNQRKAYSYLRFSTPEQMKGDSFRRQTALAQSYASKNNLILDNELTFEDLGVSAYQGRNKAKGNLGLFLEAVQTGLIERDSVLLVESLDRISRETARIAART